MKREIATIDNELRQSLDMFTQLFSLEMTLFWQKTSLKIKKDYNKHIYIYIDYTYIYEDYYEHKFITDNLLLLFLPKTIISISDVSHNDLFSVEIGSKKTIFKRFYQLYFRPSGLQHKLLILIVSPDIFH